VRASHSPELTAIPAATTKSAANMFTAESTAHAAATKSAINMSAPESTATTTYAAASESTATTTPYVAASESTAATTTHVAASESTAATATHVAASAATTTKPGGHGARPRCCTERDGDEEDHDLARDWLLIDTGR
jgi:hypothetical protein